jgi:hypothetical protein
MVSLSIFCQFRLAIDVFNKKNKKLCFAKYILQHTKGIKEFTLYIFLITALLGK